MPTPNPARLLEIACQLGAFRLFDMDDAKERDQAIADLRRIASELSVGPGWSGERPVVATSLAREMYDAAARESWRLPQTYQAAVAILEDPGFGNAGKVHDWRNHVDGVVVEFWERLTLETRMAVFIAALDDAGNERWD